MAQALKDIVFMNISGTASNNVPKRTVLYNNTSGTNGTVTLSATAANYNHMRVYYLVNRDSHIEHASVDVFTPNGKRFGMLIFRSTGTTAQFDLTGAVGSISGTSISRIASRVGNFNTGNTCGVVTDNNVYIVRVEAWNE